MDRPVETFNVFLTTLEGESAPARLVIDLDTLTVIIRDDPVAGWDLDEVVAVRTGPETVAVRAADETFTVATTRADRLERMLPHDRPSETRRGRHRSGRHRGRGVVERAWRQLVEEVRRPPTTPAAWIVAGLMALLIVATVWSMIALPAS